MTTKIYGNGLEFGESTQKGGIGQLAQRSAATLMLLTLALLGLVLAGCGGGSPAVSSQVVSGTAAVGAPLSGQVSLKDSSTPALQKTAVIGSDGSYAIDVSDLKAPYVLQAKGSADGKNYTLHSYAEGTGTANINPLSDAIVASAAEVDDPSEAFEKADHDRNHRIGTRLSGTVATILAKLEPLLKQYSAEHTNPITSHYIANHIGLDEMFDKVRIRVAGGTLSIINVKSGAVIFSGKLSDIANGVFDGGALPPAATVPAAPAALSAAGGAGQVTLTWNAVTSATSYNVYYASAPGLSTATGTKVTSVTSPYLQTGLAAGTTYYYLVTAVNSAGESAPSPQASATTTAGQPSPAPEAPAGVQATGGTNQVTLSWSPVASAASYNIYYATASGVTAASGTKIASATSPAVLTGLNAGTTYYFIVTAVNGAGEGAASAQVSAATTAAPVLDGLALYNANCSGCHGTAKLGKSAAAIQGAITANTGGMGSLALSAAEIAAIAATSAPAPALDGAALYASYCAGCHGSSKRGKTATAIQNAINSNRGGMGSLSTLTAAQITAISQY